MLTADTYTVTTLADVVDANDGVVSLREALVSAASDGATDDNDVIDFDTTLFSDGPQTILLGDTTGDGIQDAAIAQLEFDSDLTLEGPGADILTISAGNATNKRVININSDVVAEISDLTVTGGNSNNHGGGIYNRGDLTLTRADVVDNVAGLHGGGIYNLNGATLVVQNSTIDGNSADIGGGISGTFELGQSLHIDMSTISNNTSTTNSGGLNINGVSDVSLTTEILITNSTFSGNEAGTSAGAIRSQTNTELTIVNSTIYNNSAGSTVGGLFSHTGTDTLLHNTIIAGNSRIGGGTYFNDDADSILSFDSTSSNNFIGIYNSSTGLSNGTNDNQIGNSSNPLDPMLHDLDDYGGGTLTHAPMDGSPVIDTGNDAVLTAYGTENSQNNISQSYDTENEGNVGTTSEIGSFSIYESVYAASTAAYEGVIIVDLVIDEFGNDPLEPGGISLREAVEIAKQPGLNTILFDDYEFSSSQNIQLLDQSYRTEEFITLDTELIIIGPDAPLTVTGIAGSPVFVTSNRFGDDTTISHMTITGDSDTALIMNTFKDLTLDTVIVADNPSGHGVNNLQGDLVILNSTISGNNSSGNGGGIVNLYGTTHIINSTISGNSAVDGGGIYTVRGEEDSLRYAPLTIINSTISGNSASGVGGGVYTKGSDVTLANATIAFNMGTGGGIYTTEFYGDSMTAAYSGSLQADNTIIAKNTLSDGTTDSDVEGDINFSSGSSYNLIGNPMTAGGLVNDPGDGSENHNIVGDGSGGVLDPMLSSLRDNGGPTLTHRITMDSPAFDAGDPNFDPLDPDNDPNTDDALPYDQRGGGYRRVCDDQIDIGAFELQDYGSISGYKYEDVNENGVLDTLISLDEINTMTVAIDISASTFEQFLGGEYIGDVDGDGFENTILDAEIQSVIDLAMVLEAINATRTSGNEISLYVQLFGTESTYLGTDPIWIQRYFNYNGIDYMEEFLDGFDHINGTSEFIPGTNTQDLLNALQLIPRIQKSHVDVEYFSDHEDDPLPYAPYTANEHHLSADQSYEAGTNYGDPLFNQKVFDDDLYIFVSDGKPNISFLPIEVEPDGETEFHEEYEGYAAEIRANGTQVFAFGVGNLAEQDPLDAIQGSPATIFYETDALSDAVTGNSPEFFDEDTISGWTIELYEDLNDDGIFDANEQITPIATTVTDANGFYEFEDLLPGNYFVREQVQTGYLQTGPQELALLLDIYANDVASGEDLKAKIQTNGSRVDYLITIDSRDEAPQVNFGNIVDPNQ